MMTYTLTIEEDSPQATNLLRYLKNLDFIKLTKTKISKSKASSATTAPAEEVLEEDENGIPLKYKEEIMALSKVVNKRIAQRWDADLSKMNAEGT